MKSCTQIRLQQAGSTRTHRRCLSIPASARPHSCVVSSDSLVQSYAGLSPPVIVLVSPQMPENIGSAARAMNNFGCSELRLVAPKDGWTPGAPNALADATAAHAVDIVRSAKLYATAEEATADLVLLYAATARNRAMNKEVVLTRDLYEDAANALNVKLLNVEAAQGNAAGGSHGPHWGIMYGREASGLSNEEVGLAQRVLSVDANPGYPVLNLAMAVAVTTYDLYQAQERLRMLSSQQSQHGTQGLTGSNPWSRGGDVTRGGEVPTATNLNAQQLASRGEVEGLLKALFSALEAAEFYESDAAKRASVELGIRNLAGRISSFSTQDVRLLHGMIRKLGAFGRSRRAAAATSSDQAAHSAPAAPGVSGCSTGSAN